MQAGGQSPPLGAAVGLELTHRNNPHGTCHSRPNPGWTRHVHGAKEGNITLAPGAKAARPSTTTSTTSRLLSSPPARLPCAQTWDPQHSGLPAPDSAPPLAGRRVRPKHSSL